MGPGLNHRKSPLDAALKRLTVGFFARLLRSRSTMWPHSASRRLAISGVAASNFSGQCPTTMPIRIITIEREYGAGAPIIAGALADRLGWKLWDRELTAEIAVPEPPADRQA